MSARVLVIAHAHPDHSLGGGEIAAYQHWQELRRQGVDARFLARSPRPSGHTGTPFTARSPDGSDMLFHLPEANHFRHSQPQRTLVHQDFRALLERFQPTAVHFHHYVHLGLELVREVRRYSASIPIVMTLHDYLGICHAQGQMLKSSGMLCQKASPMDCHACIPGHTPQDFFMRELFIKSFFRQVDVFVSPSRFLRDRYVAWGLPAERFLLLENGQRPGAAGHRSAGQTTIADDAGDAQLAADGGPAAPTIGQPPHLRFAVLGQLSRLKGTALLLEAARCLPAAVAGRVSIEIHGTLQHTEAEFRERFLADCARLAPTVRYAGPYLPEDVGQILATVGWLIVPSIWWENSPLVIQEAFRARRPVIASQLGGLAEKVEAGRNGLLFRVGSASDLARTIETAAADASLWNRLQAGVRAPPSLESTVRSLRALYVTPRPQLAAMLPHLEARHAQPA